MKKPGLKTSVEGEVVRTSLVLPVSLWQRAKVAAVNERIDLRTFIIQAMEERLSKRPR